MSRIFYFAFAELYTGSSIRLENTLFGNYFLKCYIVKRMLISFNFFPTILKLYQGGKTKRMLSLMLNSSQLAITFSTGLIYYWHLVHYICIPIYCA